MRTKRCSGLATKSVLMESPRSRAADCSRYPTQNAARSKLESPLHQVEDAVKCIQRALTQIQNDRFTPAVLSREIPGYLMDLALQHPDDGSEFSKFVISLPNDAIHNELLRQVLPENIRKTILDRRTEHEQLQTRKETEIAEYNFENARDYRDQQEKIALEIRELVAFQELLVIPTLVASVLKRLGYTCRRDPEPGITNDCTQAAIGYTNKSRIHPAAG